MGVFGDTAYDLLGFTDPRKKMLASLTPNPVAQQAAPAPAPAVPAGKGGIGADVNANPSSVPQPPAAPPQPQAYTSGPDFSKMYLDMLNRQEGSDAVDRGMGLLFAGFAQPNDRATMVNAMSAGAKTDPATMITEMQQAQLNQGKIDSRIQLLQHAPEIAAQLKMPVQQVIAAINSGAMDDIIKEHDKATILQGSPLYKAQTGSAQAEIPLKQAQAAEAAALQRLHDAEAGGVPAKIDQAKAEAEKARAQAAQAAAETTKVPSAIDKNVAETTLAQANAAKAAADQALAEAKTRGVPSEIAKATADAAKANADAVKAAAETGAVPSLIDQRTAEAEKARAEAANVPLTPDIKNYNFAKQQWEADPKNAGKPFMDYTTFQQQGGGGGGGVKLFGTTHIQVRKDADGNTLRNPDGTPQYDVVQLADRPGVAPVKLPGLTPKITKTETGEDVQYSVQTDQGPVVLDTINKKVLQTAIDKAAGGEQGKASVDAKRAYETTNNQLQTGYSIFDRLEKHPSLDSIVGASSYLPIVRGTDRANAEAMRNQAVGVLYQQAIQSLKGVTSRAAVQEINGAKQMQGRLEDTGQTPEAYRQAIRDAKESIKRIAAIAADNAGQPRPDWVGDVKLEATPGGETRRKGHLDRASGKVIYDD
jgi:hypothetical protein